MGKKKRLKSKSKSVSSTSKQKKRTSISVFPQSIKSFFLRFYPYLVVVVLYTSAYLYIFDPKLDLNGDNYQYLNLSYSLMQGDGYVLPNSAEKSPTSLFPPGYSTLLASMQLVFGENIGLLKVLNGLFLFGTIIVMMKHLNELKVNPFLWMILGSFVALNAGLLRWGTILMSEMPYLFLSTVSLFSFIHSENTGQSKRSLIFFILSIFFASFAFHFRPVAIVVIASIIGYLLFTKQVWRMLGAMGLFTILYLPWTIRNRIHGFESRYFDTMFVVNNWRPEEGRITTVGGFLDKVAVNFRDTVIYGFPDVLIPSFSNLELEPGIVWILSLLIIGLIAIGVFSLPKYKLLFGLYLLGNVVIILVWHPGNGSRYVWPLTPYLSFFAGFGLFSITSFMTNLIQNDRANTIVPYALLSIFFIGLKPGLDQKRMQAVQPVFPAYQNYYDIAAELKRNPNDLLIAARKPEIFHYHSKKYTTYYPSSLDTRVVIQGLLESEVDYVVVEQLGYSSTPRYLIPAINEYSSLFEVVTKKENPDTYLLSFDREAATEVLLNTP